MSDEIQPAVGCSDPIDQIINNQNYHLHSIERK